ncbi:hypothetical protein V8E53_007449 [Lactarius tabidus]
MSPSPWPYFFAKYSRGGSSLEIFDTDRLSYPCQWKRALILPNFVQNIALIQWPSGDSHHVITYRSRTTTTLVHLHLGEVEHRRWREQVISAKLPRGIVQHLGCANLLLVPHTTFPTTRRRTPVMTFSTVVFGDRLSLLSASEIEQSVGGTEGDPVDPITIPSTPLEPASPAFPPPIAKTKSPSNFKSRKLKGADAVAYNLSEVATTFRPLCGSTVGSWCVPPRHSPASPFLMCSLNAAAVTVFAGLDMSEDGASRSRWLRASIRGREHGTGDNIDAEASFFDLSDTSTGDTYALREQLLAAAAL